MNRKIALTIVALTAIFNLTSLTGCANAVLVATDPRSVATVTKDQYIKRELQIAYAKDEFKPDHVSADCYNRRVLLTGQASSVAQKNKIIKIARKTDGVKKIYDYITVSPKYVSTTTDDTIITGKVKTSLFGSGSVNSNDVQVITSNGVVYLLGIIQKNQLKNMVNTAKSIEGVKSVVPLVQYKRSDTKLNFSDNEPITD
jgi:osmotically-inducible protein OsmY